MQHLWTVSSDRRWARISSWPEVAPQSWSQEMFLPVFSTSLQAKSILAFFPPSSSGRGKGVMELNFTSKMKDSFYSPLKLLIYYFKFWCLKESHNGLITCSNWRLLLPGFPFPQQAGSLSSWQLPALGFGLNQFNLTLPPWPLLASLLMETWECWRKTSWVGNIFLFCGSHVLLVEILVLTAHSLCTVSVLPIRGCRKRILLSQMPEGSINQRKTGVFQVQSSIFCSRAVKAAVPCQGWLTGGYPPFMKEW